MPLQKLQFKPGINRESTTYTNEGGWFESDKIRFRSGQPEKIGGWTNLAASVNGVAYTYYGVNRAMVNWVTLAYANLNGVGTNQKYYVENGGKYYDITPQTAIHTGLSNPFTTTAANKLITVNDPAHGASVGTWVTFTSTATVGGVTVEGDYEIITLIDGNNYTIIYAGNPTSITAGTGGGTVTAHYDISAGSSSFTTSNGWGAGGWSGISSVNTFLTSAITGTTGPITVSVTSTTGFSSTGEIKIDSEVLTYTGITATTFTGCSRGTNGTTAATHLVNAGVVQTFGWGAAAPAANSVKTQLRLWSADNFGQDLVYAPRGGAIYYWAADTSLYPRGITLKQAAQNASYANYADIPDSTLAIIASDVQRFVIAFGATSTGSSVFNPMLVRWSDQEVAYEWTPSSINQAGEYTLAGGSTIVTARTSKQEILIWTDSALFSMQYLGPPYVWGFNQLMGNTSIISPNAIASVNNQTFWMGTDKFYVYNGRVDTLPATLWQYVFNDINQAQAYQIVAGTNERYSEVWWMYPSLDSPVNNRYVIYNHLEQIWYYGNINRTAWLDSPLRGFPMGAQSVQNSFLSAALTTTPTTNATITLLNGYSYPNSGTVVIDSEYISYTAHDSADGNTLTGCTRGAVNPATNTATTVATHVQYSAVTYYVPNQVMYHENGTDDGSLSVLKPIEAYVQSSDFDIGDGLNFGFVKRMLPDVTFDGSTVAAPQLTISVRPRQNSGTNYGVGNSPTVVSGNNYSDPLVHNYLVQLFTGQVYTRIRGRQMAFKVLSTDLGVAWQLGATRIDIRPDGRR
jgi:hypothetical protein